MKLTAELAQKYALYRERFLSGSTGTYLGHPGGLSSRNQRYLKDGYAPFMVTAGNAALDIGTYLHIDRSEVENATGDQLELSNHLRLHFGDNTVYSSVALVCFVSEYSITRQSAPLEIAIDIARAFQRLGGHQRGFQEQGAAPFGFILRHDSCDDASDDENFLNYGSGVGKAAKPLAPSLDQYSAVLPCLLWAKLIIDETPNDPQNVALRNALSSLIAERVERVLRFIAFDTIYTIRWDGGGAIQQPDEKRGPYCHAAAYPMARIASRVLDGSPDQHLKYLGELGLATVADITTVLLDKVSEAVREKLVPLLRNGFVRVVMAAIGGPTWAMFAELLDVTAIVTQEFNNRVLIPVTQKIIDPILQKISSWGGMPGNGAINDTLGQIIFDAFVTGVLLDTSDAAVFKNSTINLSIKQILELVGNVSIPTDIAVDVTIKFEPSKPGWWNEDILGDWPAPSLEQKVVSFKVDTAELLNAQVPIPASGLLRKIISLSKGQSYLKFLVFNLLSASDTFGKVGDTDAVNLAAKYDNSWFMAVAHRFHGANANDSRVSRVLNVLQSAPATFPNGKATGHWNQDFRWIRDYEAKDEPRLYSGLDFMAPLMLAACVPADLAHNQEILLEALSSKLSEDTDVSHFRLPFQGPINDKVVFSPHAGGTQNDTVVYVGVLFERTIGNGVVTLKIPRLQGGFEEVEFKQDERRTMLIAAPLTEDGIVIKSANASAKGVIVLAPGN